MGRDDSSRPGHPRGFDHPGRSLTPISARRIVTSGASEIVVDDFIDTYLRERPKTIPEISLHQPPPEPVEPPPPAPLRPSRATRRGLGPNATPRKGQDAVRIDAPDTSPDDPPRDTLPHEPADEATAQRLLAARDERISQLEDELKRVKGDLAAAQRQSEPDVEPRTQMFRAPPPPPAAPRASDAQGAFRPAAPPRPAAPAVVRSSVKTVPMAAVAAPPRAEAQRPPVPSVGGAPLPAAPSPAVSAVAVSPVAVSPVAASLAAAPAVAPPPSAFVPSSSSASPASPDPGAPTMVLDRVPDAPSVAAPPAGLDFHAAPSSPPAPGSSGLTPAPFVAPAPDEGASPPAPPPALEAPVASRPRGRTALVLSFVALLGLGAVGAFSYLRGLGPFARAGAAGTVGSARSVSAEPTGHVATTKDAPPPRDVASPARSASVDTSPARSASVDTSPARPEPSASAASAAPSSSASAAPAAPESPSPDAPRASADDLKTLLSFQAFLTVSSSTDAAVVVQGQEVGRTNQRLVVRCGPKNVRLRGEGGAWVSDGLAVQITCMDHAIVRIERSP